jgi:hypothetical protein
MQVVVVGDKVLCEGDWLSLNGSTGEVILGKLPLSPPALSSDLGTFMSWVDEIKQLKVKKKSYHCVDINLFNHHDWLFMILSTFRSNTISTS